MTPISNLLIRFGQIFLWLYSKFVVNVILQMTVDKIPVTQTVLPRVIVSNHVTLFDAAMLMGTLSWQELSHVSPIRPLLAKWYYFSPLLPIAYLIGCYPTRPLFKVMKRYAGTAAAIRYANSGCTLGIYPEGKRVKKRSVTAKYGVVKILSELKSPEVYTCLITKQSRRHYTITLRRADKVASMREPAEIMNYIFNTKGTPKS